MDRTQILRRNIKVTIFHTRTNEIKGPNIKFIKGNISDFKKVLKATRGHNYVLNFEKKHEIFVF